MFTNEQREKYIDLVAVKRVVSGYASISEIEKIDKDIISKKWSKNGGIYGYIASKLDIELGELLDFQSRDDVLAEKEKIDRLFKNQFSGNKDREIGFGSFENFYNWYKKQNDKCYYCNTDASTLEDLFMKKLNSTKFNETLHIERLRPKEAYSEKNCRLACSLCNNAKSDLISEENYKIYFAKCMGMFLKDLSNDKIENKFEGDNK